MKAIELVRKGFYVLPLWNNGKNPITRHGVNDAKNTEEHARTFKPDYNIGIACKNILVIDVDVKNGNGLAELAEMEKELGKLDPKGKVVTQSGGWHLYFRKPDLDIIGQTHLSFHGKKTQIDLRVGDQYVVAPPSVYNGGAYRWEIEPESVDSLTELPQAWLDFLPKRPVFKPVETLTINDNIPVSEKQERCWRYLSKEERPAIQGQGGQNQMFRIMNVIFNGFGLSKQDGYPILMQYNAICMPPWDMGNSSDVSWIDKTIDKAIASPKMRRGCLLDSPRKDDRQLPSLSPEFFSTIQVDDLKKYDVDDISVYEREAGIEDNVLPAELFDVPGFISSYIQVLADRAPYYNKHTFFCGALAFISLLAGARFSVEGVYANLYLINLARSGEGKEAPRNFNMLLVGSMIKDAKIMDNFSSGEAIEEEVLKHERVLIQADECDLLFASIAQAKESYQRTIQNRLLSLYSKISSFLIHRSTGTVGNKNFNDVIRYNPCLVFYGAAPPSKFYEALSKRMTEGGLFARLLTIAAPDGERMYDNRADYETHPLYQKLSDFARLMLTLKVSADENPNFVGTTCKVPAIEIPYTPNARKAIIVFSTENDVKKKMAGNDEAKRSVYNRVYENTKKLAILYELSRKMDIILSCRDEYKEADPEQIKECLIIDEEVAAWAVNFMKNLLDVQEKDFSRYYHNNEHEKIITDVYNYIKSGYNHSISRTKVYNKYVGIPGREIDGIISDLLNQRRIRLVRVADKKGKSLELLTAIVGD